MAQFPDLDVGFVQGVGDYSPDLPFRSGANAARLPTPDQSGRQTGTKRRLNRRNCQRASATRIPLHRGASRPREILSLAFFAIKLRSAWGKPQPQSNDCPALDRKSVV